MKKYQALDLHLQSAIEQISSGKIQLPEFQRKFKWKKAEQQSLLESIQKNYPVGSLLLLEVSQDEEHRTPFFMRLFDGVTKSVSEPKFLVLDGQQRLTTCFRAFTSAGDQVPVVNLKKMFEAISKPSAQSKESFFAECIEWRSKPDHLEGLLFSENLLAFSFLRDRSDLRERLSRYRKNLQDNPTTLDFGNFVEVGLESHLDVFFEYQFPCVVLPSDLDLEAVANVFTKINTTGLKLSAFDLCVSTLYPKGIRLRAIWEDAKSDSLVASRDDDGTLTLQALALISNVDSKKATLFKSITKDVVNRNWEKTIEGIKIASKYLEDIGVPSSKTVPYDAMLPALSAALADTGRPSSVPSVALRKSQIARWVLQTAFSQRYTEGIDTKRVTEFPLVVDFFKNSKLPDFLESPISWQNSQMPGISNSGARFKAFLILLNRSHPRDFYETAKSLGIDMPGRENGEIHHLFPRGYLKTLNNYEASDADKAFNMTLLSRESNNFISDKAPSKYIAELEAQLLSNGVRPDSLNQEIQNLFSTHLVSSDALQAMREDDFEKFLRIRSTTTLEILRSQFQIPVEETLGVASSEDDSEDLG